MIDEKIEDPFDGLTNTGIVRKSEEIADSIREKTEGKERPKICKRTPAQRRRDMESIALRLGYREVGSRPIHALNQDFANSYFRVLFYEPTTKTNDLVVRDVYTALKEELFICSMPYEDKKLLCRPFIPTNLDQLEGAYQIVSKRKKPQAFVLNAIKGQINFKNQVGGALDELLGKIDDGDMPALKHCPWFVFENETYSLSKEVKERIVKDFQGFVVPYNHENWQAQAKVGKDMLAIYLEKQK